jgi:hypothetical protein
LGQAILLGDAISIEDSISHQITIAISSDSYPLFSRLYSKMMFLDLNQVYY